MKGRKAPALNNRSTLSQRLHWCYVQYWRIVDVSI